MASNPDRNAQRIDWAHTHLGPQADVRKLAGDASFRSYYRIEVDGRRLVLMDAPPEHEDVRPFLSVRHWMEAAGVRVPHILESDLAQGFLLLEDFGDTTWAVHAAAGHDLTPLFADALQQIHAIQAAAAGELPPFDVARMRRECELIPDWYLPKVAGIEPTAAEREAYHAALLPLIEELARLPAAPVHLDYHSRNLMLPASGLPLGVIDFQDAVHGPITYDLASLLYDCYQDYPEEQRLDWSRAFFAALPAALAAQFADFDAWHRALRLTAMQRHIKAIGIFARLAHRDGKLQFLGEIPLTRKHLLEETAALGIDLHAIPLLQRLAA